MKKLIVILCSLMLIQLFACAKTSDTLKPGETIKIGFIGPMTGDDSGYGILPSQAVRIAIDEFNEQGGINGFKIQLIIEDSIGNAETGIQGAGKLVKTDKVLALVGDSFSSVSLAIAPIVNGAKVVMISPGSTHKDLPNKGDFIFRTIISDAVQAVIFAKYLFGVENIQNAAILYTNNVYSKGIAMDFWSEFENAGGHLVAVESADQGAADFRPQLKKIKDKNPDILYLPNYVSDIVLMVKQAKEIGLKAKMYSADAFGNTQIFELLGDLTNEVVFTQKASVEASQKKKDFAAKYEAKWGIAPDDYSYNAYDATYIILNAIKQTSSKGLISGSLNIDRDQVRNFIAATKDFDGVSGNISFTDNGDLIGNIGIFSTENKKFKQLESYKLDGLNLIKLQ